MKKRNEDEERVKKGRKKRKAGNKSRGGKDGMRKERRKLMNGGEKGKVDGNIIKRKEGRRKGRAHLNTQSVHLSLSPVLGNTWLPTSPNTVRNVFLQCIRIVALHS